LGPSCTCLVVWGRKVIMSPLVRAFVPVTANLSKKADINRKYEVNCVDKQ